MAKAKAERPSFTFSKGLNTDAPLVVFPPDFSTDEVNFELMLDGTRRKRRGLEAEGGNSELPIPITEGFVVRTFKWRSVNTNPDLNFHVWQIGYTLVFADDVPNPTSSLRSFTLDLRGLGVVGHQTDTDIGTNLVDMAFGRGHAVVVSKYIEPTLLVYDQDNDVVQASPIDIRERDFQGIEDGVNNVTHPSTASDEYIYNLVNQGWVYGDIQTFQSQLQYYPSKNMVPWLGFRRLIAEGYAPEDGTKEFSPDKLIAELFQDAPAPKGHFIQNPFNTTVNVEVESETIKNYGIPYVNNPPGDPNNKPDPAYGFNLPDHDGVSVATNLLTIKFQNPHFLSVGETFQLHTETNGRIGSFTGDGNRFWSIGLPNETNPVWQTQTVETVIDDFTVQFYHNLKDDGPGYQAGWVGASWPTLYAYVGGAVLNIDGRIIDERPTCTAFYAGRVWYAGVPNAVLGSALFFSQIVEVDAQYGKCYQIADPTDENISDLLATDGGVLRIPEMGRVLKLLPYSDFLIVYASNGIWQIGPGSGGYFAANSYSVRKLSDVGCESAASVVLAESVPAHWGRSGIFAIAQDTNTGYLVVQSLTRDKIDNFYKAISEEDRRNATGDFDEINKRIMWVYHETDADDEEVYKALVLDIKFGAFTPWEFGVQVHDIFTTTDTLSSDVSTLRFIATTDFGTTQVAKATSTTFRDFGTDPYTAYLVTGYDTAQAPTRFKYAPVITSFMKRAGPAPEEPSFFLTSRPYPIEIIEALNTSAVLTDAQELGLIAEAVNSNLGFEFATLDPALITYTLWPAEAVDTTVALLSGALSASFVTQTYTIPAEAVDTNITIQAGSLIVKLITYLNYPPEAINTNLSIQSGSLT